MKTKVIVKAFNIDYDLSDAGDDGHELSPRKEAAIRKKLPKFVLMKLDLADLEDMLKDDSADHTDQMNTWICDYLSDLTGWCINSYDWCFV